MRTPLKLVPTTKPLQKIISRFVRKGLVVLGLSAVIFTGVVVYTNLVVRHDSLGKTNDVSYPVSNSRIILEYFRGSNVQKNEVFLEWATKSERNNDYFSIERSENGEIFETIKQINGAGNSRKRLHYDFIDYSPFKGTNHYRLKQTDYDGKFEYSKTITINIEGDNIQNSNMPVL